MNDFKVKARRTSHYWRYTNENTFRVYDVKSYNFKGVWFLIFVFDEWRYVSSAEFVPAD